MYHDPADAEVHSACLPGCSIRVVRAGSHEGDCLSCSVVVLDAITGRETPERECRFSSCPARDIGRPERGRVPLDACQTAATFQWPHGVC